MKSHAITTENADKKKGPKVKFHTHFCKNHPHNLQYNKVPNKVYYHAR